MIFFYSEVNYEKNNNNFLVILLCGCQTTNNHKVKTVKKTQDYQQLSKYEIIDFKIIDHNLIFVYKKIIKHMFMIIL